MIAWQQASLILFNTNFGINFVLYCISGQNFRKALFMLCCPRRPRATETTRVTGMYRYRINDKCLINRFSI
ncbi:UNVERIFIED_CONTAM: hypothetical protein PYX00_001273 [Menopon gallinae]|uniref:Secreted protein n=1 Tax=Menopon gallinae TaxID=328185 RepID=A0AAW2IBP7_9NEOP